MPIELYGDTHPVDFFVLRAEREIELPNGRTDYEQWNVSFHRTATGALRRKEEIEARWAHKGFKDETLYIDTETLED